MKAFISYSHQDDAMLNHLHKHLAQLQREGLISTWTDKDILTGGNLNNVISSALEESTLFIALVSPDYIASNYCYNKEFQRALELQSAGMIIVPVIVEPCDWLSTPLSDFKAVPRDGKPISNWENINTAFLDVVQNIRKLINSGSELVPAKSHEGPTVSARNYRVQKDFDSIEKMEFTEKSMHEVIDYLKRYLDEITGLDNIRARILVDSATSFECLIVNRNKIATESQLEIAIDESGTGMFGHGQENRRIVYSINSSKNNNQSAKAFNLDFDDYHLYWSQAAYTRMSDKKPEYTSQSIAEIIWNEWLESVGIL
jgi:hypothetical protein